MIVCVLDLDETLGYHNGSEFVKRPHADLFVRSLRNARIDLILWSYGEDEYVKRVVNSTFPLLVRHARKLFARRQCEASTALYSVPKCSEHVRKLYAPQPVYLLGVDDRANEVMDTHYDARYRVEPFSKWSPGDVELVRVIDAILQLADEKE